MWDAPVLEDHWTVPVGEIDLSQIPAGEWVIEKGHRYQVSWKYGNVASGEVDSYASKARIYRLYVDDRPGGGKMLAWIDEGFR